MTSMVGPDGLRSRVDPRGALVTSLDLATTPLAAGTARRECRAVLGGWAVPLEVTDAVVLVVSELVTNAGRHAFPRCLQGEVPSYGDLTIVERMSLTLRLVAGGVAVEVSDRNPMPPRRRDPSVWDEAGRGLMIVESLSSRVTVDPVREGGRIVGKVVRAVVPYARS